MMRTSVGPACTQAASVQPSPQPAPALPAAPRRWAAARRILCIRLDNLGDVLMTTPAIRALKHAVPGRRITLLASRSGAALAPFLQDVDDVIAYDAAWVKNGSEGHAADRAMVERLAAEGFDAAVIFTVYSQNPLPSALMCHLAGIPLVAAHCRENPYRLLSDWVKETDPGDFVRHEVRRQLDLVETLGARCEDTRLGFATRDRDRLAMREVLRRRGIATGDGWIVAHCGATAASRRYAPERFAEAFSLLEDVGLPILLTGTAHERELVEEIRSRCRDGHRLHDLAGSLSLGEFACLIEDARLLISNNTGPVHLAAALQTPVVDLYALTNPQHTPWQVAQRVLSRDVPCKYCYKSICPEGHHACLQGVAPADVAAAAKDLLGMQVRRDPPRVAAA